VTDTPINEEDFPTVEATPHREFYEWGEIGFEFYDGWIEDVRTCAHGLRNRVATEGRKCNPADRLLGGIRSIHYENRPPPKPVPRWSDRLHRFFDFLATGGYSALERK